MDERRRDVPQNTTRRWNEKRGKKTTQAQEVCQIVHGNRLEADENIHPKLCGVPTTWTR